MQCLISIGVFIYDHILSLDTPISSLYKMGNETEGWPTKLLIVRDQGAIKRPNIHCC